MTRGRRYTVFAMAFVAAELALILFLDRPLSVYLRSVAAERPGLIDVFRAYTDFGKSEWFLWPLGTGIAGCAAALRLSAVSKAWKQWIAPCGAKLSFLFAAVAASGIVTDTIKPILGRARPVELLGGIYDFAPFTFDARWNSMPSGHTTTAFALGAALSLLFPGLKPLWSLFAFAIALSRVMVNAHYLSDTLAGAAVGILTVFWFWRLRGERRIAGIRDRLFPIDRPMPAG